MLPLTNRVLKGLILFIFLFLVTGALSTALAANLTVSPSQIVPFQQVTFNVTGCDPNSKVTIKYRKNGTGNVSYWVALWQDTDADGNYTATSANFGEAGIYSVIVSCQGQDWSFPDILQVEEFTGEITLQAGEAVAGEAILVVGGCPPNGEVLIDWKKLNASGTLINFGQLEDVADANGVSESLFKSGTYIVDAACGGKNSQSYSFTVSGDDLEDDLFPTLPLPPEPPCNLSADGRCVSVKTAIGEINTNGAGIIYNLFTVALSLSGGILLITIMVAGYQLIISKGNPEQIQKARELLTSAIVGFLFMIFSYVILTVITVDILQIPGFGYDIP